MTFVAAVCFVLAANRLENPGFEQVAGEPASAPGWVAFGQPPPEVRVVATQPHAGRRCVQVFNRSKGFGGVEAAVRLNQKAVVPLYISGWARVQRPDPGVERAYTFGLSYSCRYADGSAKWETAPELCFDPGRAGWQRVRFVWRAPKPIESLTFRAMYSEAGTAWFDDLELVELTPEVLASGLDLGPIRPVAFTEGFSGAGLPDFLQAHLGQWEVREGHLRTAGEDPGPGWYVRSRYQYNFSRWRLRVRKEAEGGIVFIHTRGHRFLLRPNELMVKRVDQPDWFYSISRPIRFEAGRWYALGVDYGEGFMDIWWDGQKLVHYTGPPSEWPDPAYRHAAASGQATASDKDILVLHPWQTHAAFDDLGVEGMQMGEAQGFVEQMRYPTGFFMLDNRFQRLAPREPVRVTWPLAGEEAAAAGRLPPVEGWRIERFGPDREPRTVRVFDYAIVKADAPLFPPGLWHRRYNCPGTVRIFFNNKRPGVYTLKLGIGSAKNLANLLEVAVNGRVVSREVYRGLNATGTMAPALDYVPLDLPAGPCRLDLNLSSDLLDRTHGGPDAGWYWKFSHIHWSQPIELVPGRAEPVQVLSAREPENPAAAQGDPAACEQFAKVLHWRITDLPADGPATVRLGFCEVLLDSPGQRLMDIAINGRPVATDFDVVAEAGGDLRYITREFPATVHHGTLTVQIVGKTFQAMANALAVLQAGRCVFSRNLGWTPEVDFHAYRPRAFEAQEAVTYEMHVDPQRNEAPANAAGYASQEKRHYFEGHNLVANPRLTFQDEAGLPFFWRSVHDLRRELKPAIFEFQSPALTLDVMPARGEYRWDPVGHEGPGSLHVGRTEGEFGVTTTFPCINAAQRQRFSAWVKTAGVTGRVYLQMRWYAQDYLSAYKQLPNLRPMGEANGPAVTGTHDWTPLAVEARPPLGAAVAGLFVRVDRNTAGDVWVDDAYFDAYGAEPLEITRSHLGFHPAGVKWFIVKSRTDGPVTYRLLEAAGACVREGEARRLGFHPAPDRYYARVDLTAFDRPGRYELEARQGDAVVRSGPFDIDAGVYRRLSRVLLNGIDAKRFNAEIPGVHEPSHLDDYINFETLDRFDHQKKVKPNGWNALGGFYDAGDRIKHWEFAPCMTFGPMNVAALAGPDRLAEEGWRLTLWGLDNLARMQRPDGSFVNSNHPYHYDSIPFYGVERFCGRQVALPQMAGLFARAALRLKGTDAARAGRYQHVAEKIQTFTRNGWAVWTRGRPLTREHDLLIAPKLAFGSAFLWKLTGRPDYRQELDDQLRLLCQALESRAYLGKVYRSHQEYYGIVYSAALCLDFAWMPTFILEEAVPDHPLAERLKQALRVFVADVERLANIEPWGQALNLTPEGETPARFPGERPLSYWTMLAFSLGRLGRLLGDRAIIHLGERQLQWALGCNDHDMCLVHGIGERFVAGGDMFFIEAEFFRAFPTSGRRLWYYDGCVPTMAYRPERGQVRFIKGNDFWPPIYGAPVGFTPMFLQPDYPVHPGPTEYWQPLAGNFTSGAAAIAAALDR